MLLYSNMRQMMALFLLAITLMSNGMIDFAVKVCHSTQYNNNTNDHIFKVNQKTENNQVSSKSSKSCCSKKLKKQAIFYDEHPCCRSTKEDSYKCCTFLNLYYFTPKFHEDQRVVIPSISWIDLNSFFANIDQSTLIPSQNFDISLKNKSSTRLSLVKHDIATQFCVWLI
jgi:hypothetical protein